MPGLNQMSSVSSAGSSVITLQFSLALNLDIASRRYRRRSTRPAICCPRTCRRRRSIPRSIRRTRRC
jgi:multidrug efflux pump